MQVVEKREEDHRSCIYTAGNHTHFWSLSHSAILYVSVCMCVCVFVQNWNGNNTFPKIKIMINARIGQVGSNLHSPHFTYY